MGAGDGRRVRRGSGTPRGPGTLRIASGLVLAHIVFGIIKLVGYEETESLGFFAVDLVLLALLALTSRGVSPGRARTSSPAGAPQPQPPARS